MPTASARSTTPKAGGASRARQQQAQPKHVADLGITHREPHHLMFRVLYPEAPSSSSTQQQQRPAFNASPAYLKGGKLFSTPRSVTPKPGTTPRKTLEKQIEANLANSVSHVAPSASSYSLNATLNNSSSSASRSLVLASTNEEQQQQHAALSSSGADTAVMVDKTFRNEGAAGIRSGGGGGGSGSVNRPRSPGVTHLLASTQRYNCRHDSGECLHTTRIMIQRIPNLRVNKFNKHNAAATVDAIVRTADTITISDPTPAVNHHFSSNVPGAPPSGCGSSVAGHHQISVTSRGCYGDEDRIITPSCTLGGSKETEVWVRALRDEGVQFKNKKPPSKKKKQPAAAASSGGEDDKKGTEEKND